ncbi:MAG: hypothetical protein AB7Q00_13320 [Phycisphaerales bacterium]|nr:MAG: hypothetical protein IPK69_04005 [Phycisphaerales bacterium]
MADEKEAKQGGEGGEAKKKPPIKMIAVVAVVMVLEAVAVFMVAGMTGKPKAAEAVVVHGDEHPEENLSVEVTLLEEEFQTLQGSQIWIWDTNMVLKVKAKDQEYVEAELERRHAEIREAIATMFRKAQPNQLREPGFETINRQVSAYLEDILGKDAEGHPRFEKVLIPRCRGFGAG